MIPKKLYRHTVTLYSDRPIDLQEVVQLAVDNFPESTGVEEGIWFTEYDTPRPTEIEITNLPDEALVHLAETVEDEVLNRIKGDPVEIRRMLNQ